MKKFLALAGIAASLLVAAPAAFADSRDHRGYGYEHNDRGYHNDRGRHSEFRHMQRRDFGHWRPYLMRSHYRSFGRPVFYDNYYRVPARDRFGRHVMLTVNAYNGVIISVR